MRQAVGKSSSRRAAARRHGLAAALAFGVAMAASAGASAQVGVDTVQRTFINLGFEEPNLGGSACRVYIDQDFVPGWTTSHGPHAQGQGGPSDCVTPPGYVNGELGNIIELWNTPVPRNGVSAREGTQLAELNAEQLSRLSQNVCLVQGELVRWRFSHRGRASPTTQDQMQFLIGSDPIVHVGTTNDGSGGVIQTYLGSADSEPVGGGWRDYEGSFTWNGAGGPTDIGFEALSGSATEGNFLDQIEIFLMPFVELNADAFETVEGTTDGAPTLSIAGTVETDLSIVVTVTGGTAVLGTDFNTPGGGATFSVIVPAGTYDGAIVDLGLEAIGNDIIDGTRTVELRLEVSDDYVVSSTDICGGEAITDTAWSILDDDLDLSIQKTVDPVTATVGDTVTYTLLMTHIEGVDGSGAVVRDPQVDGLDCSAATLSCSAAGNAECPASPTIGGLQGDGLVIPLLQEGGSVEISFSCEIVGTP